MYERFYGFERAPFKLVADPSMLFASESAREALGRLEFCVKTGKGIVVMTGEVGTGKTTLVNRFLDKAPEDLQTAYIFNPTLSGQQLLHTVAEELGVRPVPESKSELTRSIYDRLLANRQSGRRSIVFVDEAQVLQPEALEELRLVSNLETWQDKLLHIVLVGQPEFLQTLESFELRPLRQRVELFIQIGSMSAEETGQYVQHRLRAAKPSRNVAFDTAALDVIHAVSGGNPRDINKICDAALLVAYVDEARVVSPAHVQEAIETIDAQGVSLRQRHRRRWRLLPRLSLAAATLAAVAALVFTLDSRRSAQIVTKASDEAERPELSVAPFGAEAAAPVEARPAAAVVAAQATTTLIHLASFEGRRQAEEFAASLRPGAEHTVYLQVAESPKTTWYRVLLGDFESLAEAEAFAQRAQGDGTYAYAQAVRVTPRGLETWTRR